MIGNFEMICAIAISTVVTYVGLIRVSERLKLYKHGIRTTGNITQIERIIKKNKISFVPTISYLKRDGKQIHVRHSDSIPIRIYKINDKLPIIYDDNDSENLIIVSKTISFIDFFITIVGFLSLIFCLLTFLF